MGFDPILGKDCPVEGQLIDFAGEIASAGLQLFPADVDWPGVGNRFATIAQFAPQYPVNKQAIAAIRTTGPDKMMELAVVEPFGGGQDMVPPVPGAHTDQNLATLSLGSFATQDAPIA